MFYKSLNMLSLTCLLLLPAACATSQSHGHNTAAGEEKTIGCPEGCLCDACVKGKAGEKVWCEKCSVGYINGKVVKCKACFKGKSGESSWCERCKSGHTDGKKITCKSCYRNKAEGAAPCAHHAK